MKNIIVALALAGAILSTSASAQTLLAGYDFQTGSNATAASPNTPTSYISPFGTELGSAALYLDGTHGSSSWASATQLNAFAGTAINAASGMSTTTSGAASLALVDSTANNFSVVFALSMTGYDDLTMSFASQRTGTGFTGNTISYSLDGINFTQFATGITPAASFALITEDFSSVSALNNASTVYIQYTVEGASSTSGNNRLDNVQFNATLASVPEPSTMAMALSGIGTLVTLRRRKRRA